MMSGCWSLLVAVSLGDKVSLVNPELVLLPVLSRLWRKRCGRILLLLRLLHVLFLVCKYLCLLRSPALTKHLPHCLHSYGFCPVWILSWFLRVINTLKHLPHCLHLWDFSPVWNFACLRRCPPRLKHLPHHLHSKGFSPAWVLMCVARFPLWVKHLPHCLHS